MLGVKCGKDFSSNAVEAGKAEQAIWAVSVRARAVADKSTTDWPDHTSTKVPDLVKVVVLEAAYRVYKNPNRYTMNQAFQFTGQISSELDGDIFLASERESLEAFRASGGMWTQATTRATPGLYDSTGWVAVEGSIEPFPYYGPGEG